MRPSRFGALRVFPGFGFAFSFRDRFADAGAAKMPASFSVSVSAVAFFIASPVFVDFLLQFRFFFMSWLVFDVLELIELCGVFLIFRQEFTETWPIVCRLRLSDVPLRIRTEVTAGARMRR